MNAVDPLQRGLLLHPERVAVVEGTRQLTFAEVDARARRLVGAFQREGLRPGDRVALLARNELEHLELQVAAQRAGLVFVPLNYRLAPGELRAIVDDCRPGLLVCGDDLEAVGRDLRVGRRWSVGRGAAAEEHQARLAGARPLDGIAIEADVPAMLLYTSGTTGRSKGVVLTNAVLDARMDVARREIGISGDDTLLFSIPLFHASSCIAAAFTASGATVVQLRTFETGTSLQAVRDRAATHVVLVPTILGRWISALEADASAAASLRMVIYGGSPISADVLRRGLATLECEFLQVYGLTEAVNVAALRPGRHLPDGRPDWLASAGEPSVGHELAVLDETGRPLDAGQVGEVVVRGPSVMAGYWHDPSETAKAVQDGWLHTGDAGYVSTEGLLSITDRLKDVIVTGGENVSAREVEDVLVSHPDVDEAAVIGVPDERWGESTLALVVPRAGARPDPSGLAAHCRDHLADYKVPKAVELREGLPRTSMGKVAKRELRAPYWQGRGRSVG